MSSYVAAENGKDAKWVQVAPKNAGKAIDAKSVKWSDNYNEFSKEDKVYPYWVGAI